MTVPAATADGAGLPMVKVALVGLAAGLLGGTFGVGGGLLIVPALLFFLHFEQRLAHGTSLAAILPISVASLLTYWAAGNIDWPAVVFLSIGAIGGAYTGTWLLHVLSKRMLTIAFAVVMLATAVRLFISTEANGRGPLDVWMVVGFVVLGLLAGTLAGLLGVGGGVVMVPALVVLVGIPPVIAKGTSVAVIVPTSVMGTWRNWRRGNVDLRVAAVIGACGTVSAVAGSLIADQLSDDVSNILFALLLLVVVARQLASLRTIDDQPPVDGVPLDLEP